MGRESRGMMDSSVGSLELQTGLGEETAATHLELWGGRGRALFVPSVAPACRTVPGAS